jgi:hypothetical protein
MRLFRVQVTIKAILITVAIAAIWLFIIAEGIKYQSRHLSNQSAWERSK